MPKKGANRIEVYAFIAVFYVVGFVFLALSRLDLTIAGVFMICIGVWLTLIAFPEILQTARTEIRRTRDAYRAYRKRVESRQSQVQIDQPIEPTSSEVKFSEAPEKVQEIISRIREFRPYRRASSERDIEYMLMQYMNTFYPSLRTQLQYERTQIDAQIEGIGIEIKYEPTESELDRLFGQIEKYLRHLEYVIVVIGYALSLESIEEFRRRLRRSGWENRVSVVTI